MINHITLDLGKVTWALLCKTMKHPDYEGILTIFLESSTLYLTQFGVE